MSFPRPLELSPTASGDTPRGDIHRDSDVPVHTESCVVGHFSYEKLPPVMQRDKKSQLSENESNWSSFPNSFQEVHFLNLNLKVSLRISHMSTLFHIISPCNFSRLCSTPRFHNFFFVIINAHYIHVCVFNVAPMSMCLRLG